MLVIAPGVPGIDSLQPLAAGVNDEPPPQPRGPDAPPVINNYEPNVEQWRHPIWDQMPDALKQRPDAASLLDKALHAVRGESGGDPSAVGDGGAAHGLFQSHYIGPNATPHQQIADAWRLIQSDTANGGTGFGDWGEGRLYQGQPFGAFGRTPYGAGDPLAQHLSTGQQSGFVGPQIAPQPYDPYTPAPDPFAPSAGQTAAGEAGQQPDYGDVSGVAPSLTSLIGRPTGGFRDTELQPDPNATTDNPLTLASRAYDAVNPRIPVVTPAIEDYLKPAVGAALNTVPGVNVANSVSQAVGGPNIGRTVADTVIPSRAADIGLAAAPFAGEAGDLVRGVRPALERAALEGVPETAGRGVEAAASPAERLLTRGMLSPEGAAMSPLEMYQKAHAMGYTDAEIAQSFGQSAVDAGRGVDVPAQREAVRTQGNDAAAHAAKRVFNNVIDQTGDVDQAAQEARRAAAAAEGTIAGRQRPNVLASDDTAAQMAAARERARQPQQQAGQETAGGERGLSEGANDYMSPQQGDMGSSYPNPQQQAGQSEADDFNAAREAAIKARAEQRGVSPNELSFKDRADAVAEVLAKLANAKPGQEVGDVLNQAKKVERVADATKAAAKPPQQASLADAQGLTGEKIDFPSDAGARQRTAMSDEQIAASEKRNADYNANLNREPPGVTPQMQAEYDAWTAGQGASSGVPAGNFPPHWTAKQISDYRQLEAGAKQTGMAGEGASIPPPNKPPVPNTQNEFGENFIPPAGYQESSAHRAFREVMSAVNAPFSLVTYGHAPIFRQGVGFALSHLLEFGKEGNLIQKVAASKPGLAFDALGNLVKVARNPEAAAALDEALNAKPFVKAAMEAGYFKDVAASTIPETFVDRVLNKIPGMQNSRQAAKAYLTTLQKLGYEHEAQTLFQMGVKDPEEYQSLFNTISDVTGHGLGGKGNLRGINLKVGGPSGINPVFSPQALLGRFRSLIDPFVQSGSFNPLAPGAKSVAIRNLLGVGGLAVSVDGIAKASGLDLKWDLLNTPLGKVSIGPSTIDPTASYGSIIRLGARALDAALSGDLGKVRDAASSFVNGQLGPVTGTGWATITGQDWQGRDFNLIKAATSNPTQQNSLARQLLVPIAANSIIDGIKAHGIVGAAIGAPSLGAMSVDTNLLQDARDKATQRLSKGAVTSYADAQNQPLLKQQVDQDPSVIDAKGGPTPYQQANEANTGPIKAQVAAQEDLFTKGQNAQKLRDVYHDATEQSIATARAQSNQFADQFKSIPQTTQQGLLQKYYDIQPKVADGLPGAGVDTDFDAQASARKDFVASLPKDQQDFINQSLQATELNKTPLHQEYDKYIDAKKQAGYFDIKPDDPKANEKRQALDVAHPDLDVAAWKFGSVAGKAGSSLNSAKAVDMALATPDAQNKEIKYQGLPRPINQSPDTVAMWKYSQGPLTWYLNDLPNGPDAVNEAKRLAGSTGDKEYAKPLADMDSKHRATVTGNLHRAALNSSAGDEIEAYLYAWGERTTLNTQGAANKAGEIIKRYHLDETKAPMKRAA